MPSLCQIVRNNRDRRSFIGGSDARIIMGSDEAALIRLWREKRGEAEPEDLSGNLIVQLGPGDRGAQPRLVRAQFRPTGPNDVQRRVQHSAHPLDGGNPRRHRGRQRGRVRGQVHAALVVLRRSRGRKIYGHSSSTTCGSPTCRSSVLSMITGGGKWVEITIPMDPLYLSAFWSTAEKKFWRCVQSGEPPASDRRRGTAATDRGHPHRRHELVEFLGGICRAVPQYPRGLSRSRAGEK